MLAFVLLTSRVDVSHDSSVNSHLWYRVSDDSQERLSRIGHIDHLFDHLESEGEEKHRSITRVRDRTDSFSFS
jgi:hypothetical protein